MSKLGDELVSSMQEAVAHSKGRSKLGTKVHRVMIDAIDVLAVRKSTGLSRAEFANEFALDVRALQDWEQRRRRPDPAARAYLTVIQKNPQAVRAALKDRVA